MKLFVFLRFTGTADDFNTFTQSMEEILSIDPEAKHTNDLELITCINLVQTKKDESMRRGAVVKALAITTPFR